MKTVSISYLILVLASACSDSAAPGPDDTDMDEDEASEGDGKVADGGKHDAGKNDAGKDASKPKDASRADADEPSQDEDAGDDEPVASDSGAKAPDAGPPAKDAAAGSSECLAPLVVAVKSQLEICRTCHVANGVAGDAKFLLSKNKTEDIANLMLAYSKVGHDLLAMPAEEDGKSHDGGKRFSKGSADYTAWSALVDGLANPEAACK